MNTTISFDVSKYPNSTTTTPEYSTANVDVVYLHYITKIKTAVLPTIFSIVFITGIIGNGLVIYIMRTKVRNRNITDQYVMNLAIADFIFVSMVPFWTTELALGDRWVFGRVMCKLVSGSTLFHMYASVFFLAAMSVDRFIAVVLYQSYGRCRTKKCTFIGILTIWFASTILGLLPLYFRDTRYDKETGESYCEWAFNERVASHRAWFVMHFVMRSIIGFVIPFMVVLACNSMIIIFLKTRKTRGKLTGKCQDRATKMVLVIIAGFLVCWLPNQISNAIYALQSLGITARPANPYKQYYIHMFGSCLAWTHSCINPILYAFMRQDLRLKLTEIINHNKRRCTKSSNFTRITNTVVRFKSRNATLKSNKDDEELSEKSEGIEGDCETLNPEIRQDEME